LISLIARELRALSSKGVERGERGWWIAIVDNKRVMKFKL